ncbi:MAG: hypothetical protein ABSC21_22540 [Terriglobia bacterium]
MCPWQPAGADPFPERHAHGQPFTHQPCLRQPTRRDDQYGSGRHPEQHRQRRLEHYQPRVEGSNASDFDESNTCGSSLAAGTNCTIAVMFTPSVVGTEAASLSIADNSSGSPQTVALSGAGTHDVILTWTASTTPGVVGYNVYRGTTSGGESTTPLNSSPVAAGCTSTTACTYTDATVVAGTTYYYTVTAVASNDVTQSADSNQVTATVP